MIRMPSMKVANLSSLSRCAPGKNISLTLKRNPVKWIGFSLCSTKTREVCSEFKPYQRELDSITECPYAKLGEVFATKNSRTQPHSLIWNSCIMLASSEELGVLRQQLKWQSFPFLKSKLNKLPFLRNRQSLKNKRSLKFNNSLSEIFLFN